MQKITPHTRIAELEKICMDHPWNEQQIRSELESPFNLTLIASAKGEIVNLSSDPEHPEDVCGYLIALILPYEKAAEILRIGVLPENRRTGLARRLLKVLEKTLTNTRELLLEVSEKNEGAIHFYESYGFTRIGKRKKYYRDGSDALLMKKIIETVQHP